jgi:hypothetical protein
MREGRARNFCSAHDSTLVVGRGDYMAKLSDIHFGYASAETERTQEPDLLLKGYVDFKKVISHAQFGPKFLFLGYKGAGKSAIAEKLSLIAENDYGTFVRIVQLGDFPFKPFSKMIRGDAEPESKFPTAWSWILLIYVLESFAEDNAATYLDTDAFQRSLGAFREMGLSPNADPAKIVRTVAKTTFKLIVPHVGEIAGGGSSIKPPADIPDYVEGLKKLSKEIRSPNSHYIVIDGLDDILTSREVQYKSLGALIFEVSRLNSMFSGAGVPIKIILLCRADLFEKVPNANKNKVRQDSAVELDWYHNPNDPGSSLLVDAANLRASRSLDREIDIFDEFFPKEIDGKPTINALLDMTRHTPRDFLQLLTNIQEFDNGGFYTPKEVRLGLRSYSIKYFLPEIHDELSGYADPEDLEKFFQILTKMGRREFTVDDLMKPSIQDGLDLSKDRIRSILKALFDCSALGNITNSLNGSPIFTFKFRNRHSVFNVSAKIILHKGLWKALNIA